MTSKDAKEQAMALIAEMRSGQADDQRQEEIVTSLNRILPDPNYFDYMIDHVPELTPAEVVARAFEYRPIIL